MIKFEHTEVYGWEAAARGMRNPLNSWSKGDTGWTTDGLSNDDILLDSDSEGYFELKLGPNDQDLMMRLRNAGSDHRKFMRMINVTVDITAPLYWWKEFDTYKVGTVANSCSTMHKIAAKEFEESDFSTEHLFDLMSNEIEYPASAGGNEHPSIWFLNQTIRALNFYRQKYLEYKAKPMENETARKELLKKYWWQMIQLLPSSYNQKRTIQMNYEVLANIYKSRKNHKLDEWSVGFIQWIESLPYSELITGEKKGE